MTVSGYVTVRDSARPWWSVTGRVLARTADAVTLVPPLLLSQVARTPLVIPLTATRTVEER